ncbi:phosphotransferase [Gracilibacillus caseinilyticus]|uniref:Phosphotransferase n=1 Tax=Gracilibacillus caseinilyticus TaxID=2932256 RepID=A0ABY4ESV7_9BACI|nr:phosphotransferase [Gracilibacillus caseinilyticus]UOQ47278.1 phosphotransferase [Gracilibacillus caseinilyticus]
MEWSQLLQSYQLQPESIEQITDRLYKIEADHQQYALKHARLLPEDVGRWQAIQQYIQEKKIFGFVPVYYTVHQQPFVEDNGDIYYLMPWVNREISDQPIDEYATAIHTIGKLHAATMDYHKIDAVKQNRRTLEKQFEQELTYCREQMLQYVRFFEAKRFMAPAELQICMYYRDMEQLFNKMEEWQEIYLDRMEETDQMKYTLCHGNVKPSHYMITGMNTYLLNWEYALMTSPTYDLVSYYQYLFRFHDCDMDKITESFSVYCRYIDLSDYEKALLVLQLLSPHNWFQSMSDTLQPRRGTSNVRKSIEIEKEFRKLFHGFQMQEYIYQTLKTDPVDELG